MSAASALRIPPRVLAGFGLSALLAAALWQAVPEAGSAEMF